MRLLAKRGFHEEEGARGSRQVSRRGRKASREDRPDPFRQPGATVSSDDRTHRGVRSRFAKARNAGPVPRPRFLKALSTAIDIEIVQFRHGGPRFSQSGPELGTVPDFLTGDTLVDAHVCTAHAIMARHSADGLRGVTSGATFDQPTRARSTTIGLPQLCEQTMLHVT